MVRRHIYFSGRVQGVGFRYISWQAARSLRLSGWVKNLWDGRVEMEVQGKPETIDRLMQELLNQRWIRIDDMEIREIPLEDEDDFVMAN